MIACCVMQFGSPPNHYTQRWFSTFLGRVDSSIVANEMSFLESVIPRATVHLVVRGDMRRLPIRSDGVDAIINMWQSFGQFDRVTNGLVLVEWARVLRPRGRLVIDLYNRAFHKQGSRVRHILRDGVDITEVRATECGRLSVTLTCAAPEIADDESRSDRFEWQLYFPEELTAEAALAGLELERVCTGFDDRQSPTPESPRMQAVFVRAD